MNKSPKMPKYAPNMQNRYAMITFKPTISATFPHFFNFTTFSSQFYESVIRNFQIFVVSKESF